MSEHQWAIIRNKTDGFFMMWGTDVITDDDNVVFEGSLHDVIQLKRRLNTVRAFYGMDLNSKAADLIIAKLDKIEAIMYGSKE
jgi:hypothetical protein